MQAIDMNQDNVLAETFKSRNLVCSSPGRQPLAHRRSAHHSRPACTSALP